MHALIHSGLQVRANVIAQIVDSDDMVRASFQSLSVEEGEQRVGFLRESAARRYALRGEIGQRTPGQSLIYLMKNFSIAS